MDPWLLRERQKFHLECFASAITMTAGVSSIADSANRPSREISAALLSKLGGAQSVAAKPAGQSSGNGFEICCRNFLERAFEKLSHLRPGKFEVARGRVIADFDQFSHLQELRLLARENRQLETLLGSDYLIKPDIVIMKSSITDATINANEFLVDDSVARLTSLRASNGAKATLHASVSCKLTMRSDRAQNARSEALNLIRNRKGRLPHIVAVTAEPMPSRIASLAMGTGDIDCVYHFALTELVAVLTEQDRDSLDLVSTMIEGKRLRDIADLPLDLVS